ncbi:MAG: phosphopantetheine-binding protein [Candidatus Falkowbacteria bacterium]
MTLANIINSEEATLRTISKLIIAKLQMIKPDYVITPDNVGFESNLMKDWGFDSLDVIDLSMDIEHRLGVNIEDMSELGEKQFAVTVGQIVECVQNETSR